jgi:hypothetical protein
MAAVIVRIYEISMLVEYASQSFIAQCVLSGTMFYLNDGFCGLACGWIPAVYKDLVSILVYKTKSGLDIV